MITFTTASLLAVYFLVAYGVWFIFFQPMFTSLDSLPGPKSSHFFLGHYFDIHFGDPLNKYDKWAEEYGHVMKIKGPLNRNFIMLSDLRALEYVFMHPMDFEKSSMARRGLAMLIGDGVVVTEGEQWRRQRRAMNVSFYPETLKKLTPIFYEESQRLRSLLYSIIGTDDEGRPKVIDMYKWFGAAILDMIGLAAFDYPFKALDIDESNPTELFTALHALYHSAPTGMEDQMIFLRLIIPELRLISGPRRKQLKNAMATWKRIGEQLIADRKQTMFKLEDTHGIEKTDFIDQSHLRGRDLLSVLVKSNADPDVPESLRMTDEEVLAQVPTFLVAGHETTATSMAWCLLSLSLHSEIQRKLRSELLAVSTENPDINDLNALPYLDAVLRESMRLHPAIPYTMRTANKDDVVPLAQPYTDKYGKVHDEFRVSKGDSFLIPFEAINRYRDIWGEDAAEFKPERWLNKLETGIPGVWANQATFLGGPRACLGYRFAIWEMKVLLFTLIRAFEFELSMPIEDVAKFRYISTRPWLRSQELKGIQMPLRVKRYDPTESSS